MQRIQAEITTPNALKKFSRDADTNRRYEGLLPTMLTRQMKCIPTRIHPEIAESLSAGEDERDQVDGRRAGRNPAPVSRSF